MDVYFHGSEIVPENVKMCTTHRLHSWGIVINHNDKSVEQHGAWYDGVALKGLHEYVAFAEAVVFIEPMGIKLEDVVFHTTSEMLRDFASILYEKNYCRSGLKESILQALLRLCKIRFRTECAEIFALLLKCLTTCRFKWVKPRNRHVYHARGAYLSKYSNRVYRGIDMEFLDFDTWIAKGFTEYDREQKEYQWYPPFANTIGSV